MSGRTETFLASAPLHNTQQVNPKNSGSRIQSTSAERLVVFLGIKLSHMRVSKGIKLAVGARIRIDYKRVFLISGALISGNYCSTQRYFQISPFFCFCLVLPVAHFLAQFLCDNLLVPCLVWTTRSFAKMFFWPDSVISPPTGYRTGHFLKWPWGEINKGLNDLGWNELTPLRKATIRPKFQKATIRPKRQLVPFWKGDNSSQLLKAAIYPQFNCQ